MLFGVTERKITISNEKDVKQLELLCLDICSHFYCQQFTLTNLYGQRKKSTVRWSLLCFFWLFKQPSDKSEKQLLYKNSYRSIIIILLIISQVTLSKKNRTVDHRIPDFQVRNKLPTYIQSSELSQGCQGKGQFLQQWLCTLENHMQKKKSDPYLAV